MDFFYARESGASCLKNMEYIEQLGKSDVLATEMESSIILP